MKNIFNEFKSSHENILGNFYMGFLSVNFINLRPFSNDIQLCSNFRGNVLRKELINRIDTNILNEYSNSLRRHFLNDMVIAYERYAVYMYVSHKNNKVLVDPSEKGENIYTNAFENLFTEIPEDDLLFLKNLKSLRNCILHYNGKYSKNNKLDYTFGKNVYKTSGNVGKNLTIEFDTLIEIHCKLYKIVENINQLYFNLENI